MQCQEGNYYAHGKEVSTTEGNTGRIGVKQEITVKDGGENTEIITSISININTGTELEFLF